MAAASEDNTEQAVDSVPAAKTPPSKVPVAGSKKKKAVADNAAAAADAVAEPSKTVRAEKEKKRPAVSKVEQRGSEKARDDKNVAEIRKAAANSVGKTSSAKSTKAKSVAARTTAAKAVTSRGAGVSAGAGAKSRVAKAAAAKNAAAKSTARTDAARVATEKAMAVKSAAANNAAAKESDLAEHAMENAVSEDAADEAGVIETAVEVPAVDVEDPAVEPETSPELPVDDASMGDDETIVLSSPLSESVGEAIRIRGLVKRFGERTAVAGIDLTVPARSFYGIVGPNGAGKTTTLSIVAGLLRSDSGSVTVCGVDQAEDPLGVKRLMGVLPDRLRTFDRLTGRQLLYYYGLLRGLASDVIDKRVADLARAFDLGDALNRVVSDYSAGMTKKLMLAGALIHSPRVLVLDEPFEAVDPVSSAVILDILRAYVDHGGTVILSSHGMDLVERVCSRVAIIVGGEVLAEGTIDEVRAGQTLEARFVELSGSAGQVEGLEWLHTFSD